MRDAIYRFKHYMIADKPIEVVTDCKEHGVGLLHVHYVHRRYLAWVDSLRRNYMQRRLKKSLTKAQSWIADWGLSQQRVTKPKGKKGV